MAVRGIAEHGLPILPSGLLYDRGILYSYVSWLAHVITGSELPAYRAVSFICAVAALWLVYKLVSRIHHAQTGLIAAALVATAVPWWATATSARFYAPFFALYLAMLLSFSSVYWLLVLAFLSRLTHELAFTLAVIPVICWIVDRDNRRAWLRASIAIVAGLLLGQALLLSLHWLSPSSGDTMVRRFFLWQVLNLFERPGERQFAIPIVVMAIAWLVAPKRAALISVMALSIFAAIVAFSIAQASNTAPLSLALVTGMLAAGSRYPLDMFWHLVRYIPIAIAAAVMLFAYRARHQWPASHRAMHALWLGWVLWFGVIESGITTNYLLLPIAFLLIAVAVDAMSIRLPRLAIWLLLVIVAIDQWRSTTLEAARPTIVAAGIEEIRNGLQPNDRVVCTDELGCLMLVGRIDRWLALDAYVRERFIVRRGDGPATGVYTGVPAAFRPSEVFAANADGTRPDRVVIVDIFKDYPIGNSRSWLPKAIEEDGVRVTPLLETAQLRVLEVSLPEALAILR
jgi:hypothetical protein